jgi:DNA polymerase IV
MKKPNAVTTITKENFKSKVRPLLASDLLYVGHATTKNSASWMNTCGYSVAFPR